MTPPTHPLAGAVKPQWKFCPECGSKDAFDATSTVRVCNDCGQDWYTDLDYTPTCQSNLSRLHRRAISAPTPPADVAGLAQSLAFVANRTGMTVERCERITDEAAAKLIALSARVAELERENAALVSALSDAAQSRGKAEGKLAASEMAGIVDSWRARAEAAEAALAGARDAAEGIDDLPEGDVRIDIEHVHGGWCGYIFVYPQHGPIVPAEREHLYTRTPGMPSRAEAAAALPIAIRAMKGKP